MVDRDKTIELLKNVIKINSINPSLVSDGVGESKIAVYLGDYLEKLGLEVHYQDLGNHRKNVIGILRGNNHGNSIILNAHTDTVGVEGMEAPFKPTFKDGKMYGRGAFDMKGGLVSCIMAISDIVNSSVELSGDVIFAGVADEEFASIGTEALINEFTADAGIICEPTNSQIVIAHKGFAWITMNIYGKAAHGSKPQLGIDAIAKANKVLNGVSDLQTELFQIKHHLVGSPTIRVAKINGGVGMSTIADKCTIYIERRTLPSESQNNIEEEIEEIINKIKNEDDEFEADFEIMLFRSGLELPEYNEIVRVLTKAKEEVTGKTSSSVGETWWMDSALMYEAGIPTVVFGPNGDGAHAAVEYVDIVSVIEIAEIIKKAIVSFCG